ncbi:glycoside hydrolase family 28 protein [Lachnoclostridium sp. Marseille-P6806]|uniref:glycoside hydrolase family 28 protein n=1 Tax=Lachnoclostridium sp. Marseille-P6806 TaxID=2364793 RepID=UPI00102FB10B|nr:glycoside hydrolase family 28 protein [Lachnoclostridium sp. Marseille-P6806]
MVYNILDYGAETDGVTSSTAAIQAAIDDCGRTGGRVLIPAGRFCSGTLMLRSNIDLHLENGATLISSSDPAELTDFSRDFEDDNADTGWEGGCFLLARHETNITISGTGTIDGQGRRSFYDDDSDGGFHECPLNVRGFRPRMSFLEDVKNLTVRDVTFYDAAFWTLHMAGCRDVLIENVRILNNERGPNNDGIDPDCCKNVMIRGCVIRGGDDAVVIKTTAPMTKKYGASENIVISGCIMKSRSCALKIGTETWGDIHGVILSDCVLEDCTRGFGIWSRDGGRIYDISIHHVVGNTRRYADCVTRHTGVHYWWGKGDPVFISATPRSGVDRVPGRISDIYMDHLRMECEGAIVIAGESGSPVENVSISDSSFLWKKRSAHVPDCLDERPSARGCYAYDVPCVYIREGRNVALDARLAVDPSLREYVREEIVREEAADGIPAAIS